MDITDKRISRYVAHALVVPRISIPVRGKMDECRAYIPDSHHFQTILKLHSRTTLIRNYSIVELVLQLGLLAIAYPYGIMAIAWSQIIALSIILCVYLFKYHRLQEEKLRTVIVDMVSPLCIPFIAFLISVAGYSYCNEAFNPFVSCVALLILFCSATVILWELFPHPVYLKYRARVLSHFNLKK